MFAIAAFFSYNYRRLMLPCFITAALVGYSRIYLGVHYPTDVMAGFVWGMLVGFPAAMIAERLTRVGQVDDPIRSDEKEDQPASRVRSSQ